MSDKGEITKQDVARFVLQTAEGNTDAGDGIAQRVMAANVVWSIWTTLGEEETESEISDEKADEIIEKLPLSFDDVAEDGALQEIET
jgi:thiamine kinase-like enzyme